MIAVIRQRNFSLLWSAGLISLIGDWTLSVALPFYVFALTGSALATGLMFMARTLPGVLFGGIAGVFVDRWDRKRTMILANLSATLLVLSLLTVKSVTGLWVVYLVAFIESSIMQFFGPAEKALLPCLLTERNLATGTGVLLKDPQAIAGGTLAQYKGSIDKASKQLGKNLGGALS